MAVPIYDWPQSVKPQASLVIAGGQYTDGGFTAGGAAIGQFEPGGRTILALRFATMKNAVDARLASWLMSAVGSAYFRIRIDGEAQTLSLAEAGEAGNEALLADGVGWDDGEFGDAETLFDDDTGWEYEPALFAGLAADEGAEYLTVSTDALTVPFPVGVAIGHRGSVYMVREADTLESGTAVLRLSPPLRRAVAVADPITFKPFGVFRCADPQAFRALFAYGRFVQPGEVRFIEVPQTA